MTSVERIKILEAIRDLEDFDNARLFINGVIFDLTNLYFEIDLDNFELSTIDNYLVSRIYFKDIKEIWIFDGNANQNKEILKLKIGRV